jgi:hypothetical protein
MYREVIMKKIMINIDNYDDRKNIISILAHAGYTVRVKVEEDNVHRKTYWVIFDLPDLNIKD